MIKIRARAWMRYCWIVAAVAIPLVAVLLLRIGSDLLQNLCFGVIVLFGLSGAAVALLERLGLLKVVYTASDRRKLLFGLARDCAAMERGIWGKSFSESYYENYLGEPVTGDAKEKESV